MIFRPPRTLRALFAVLGIVCAWAALWQAGLFAAQREPKRLAAALVVSLPCWLAMALLRKAVVVREDGLRSTTLLGTRLIPWEAIYRLDQTRHSFVVETQQGPVSAGWLARPERERLRRLILQKARLTLSREKWRWGLVARYVPRAQSISLGEFQRPGNRRDAENTEKT